MAGIAWGRVALADLILCERAECARHRYTVYYARCMAKTLTAIRLEPKRIAELEKIAKREDRAVSYLIRKAIDEYVARHKKRKP